VKAGLLARRRQRGNSDLDGIDQAAVLGLSCADWQRAGARRQLLRGDCGARHPREREQRSYDVALLANGRLQIRRKRKHHHGPRRRGERHRRSRNWATIALNVSGAGRWQLVASVNGVPKVSVTDSSASAIVAAGTAGI